jgi:hypothetical protein
MQAINWQYQAMKEKHWAHEDLEYQKKNLRQRICKAPSAQLLVSSF